MKRAVFSGIAVSIATLLAAGVLACFLGFLQFNHPNPKKYPVMGIDVSHHQGEILWQDLKRQNIQFAYIKATEGGDWRDPAFRKNWENSEKAGLVRGAYHFFTFCKPGKEQVENFLRTVPVEAGTLPPAIDFEFVGNCNRRPSKPDMLKEVGDFVRAVERKYGQSPIFYVNYDSYDAYLKGEVEGYHLWIRDTFWAPRLSDGRSWTFWQYDDRGRIEGIRGPVDLNVFNGSEGELRKLCQ